MKPNLTEKENGVYRYICEATEANGYSPSVRDIQEALGIKSTATVHSYLNKLESKGYIQKAQGKSRTLRVDIESTPPRAANIPVVGQVAAGLPIQAQENCEGYLEFCPPKGNSFLFFPVFTQSIGAEHPYNFAPYSFVCMINFGIWEKGTADMLTEETIHVYLMPFAWWGKLHIAYLFLDYADFIDCHLF